MRAQALFNYDVKIVYLRIKHIEGDLSFSFIYWFCSQILFDIFSVVIVYKSLINLTHFYFLQGKREQELEEKIAVLKEHCDGMTFAIFSVEIKQLNLQYFREEATSALKPAFHMIFRIVSKNVQTIGTIIWKLYPDDRKRPVSLQNLRDRPDRPDRTQFYPSDWGRLSRPGRLQSSG